MWQKTGETKGATIGSHRKLKRNDVLKAAKASTEHVLRVN